MNKIDIIKEVIKSRRSTFTPMYTGEKIEDHRIWEILEMANWAPTHKYTEPWFFKVIPQEKIHEFCAYGAEWYKEFTPKAHFSELKWNKIKKKALSASHIIVICMKRDPKKRIPKWEEEAAVACSVQNMWLTATAMGFGSYWSTPGYALNGSSFFGLNKGEKCMGLFYIGIPKNDLDIKSTRQDISTKVTWM